MKVGTLAYATDQGLGVLAKAFHHQGVVTHPMVVIHDRRISHMDWYKGHPSIAIRDICHDKVKEHCRSVDVMFFFETPFYWDLIPYCKEHKVKTVLMPMYECMPTTLPYQPDLIINPSALDQRYYPNGIFIPVPVQMPWRQRTRACHYVHNSGNGGLKGRNGTMELLQAMEHVKMPLRLTIRCQTEGRYNQLMKVSQGPNVDIRTGTVPYESLFEEGDVFVFPEKFNGLSLPLQEAYASGMLVMATNRFPMNTWLPTEPLIRAAGTGITRVSGRCAEFQESIIHPKDIAAKMDEWYYKDIFDYSVKGLEWAKTMSWDVLKPRYVETLEKLL